MTVPHLPADVRYDLFDGEYDLARWIPSSVDDAVSEFAAKYARAAVQERRAANERLAVREIDTLVTFARRRSVQAIRETKPTYASAGLIGLAATDPNRADPRDLRRAAGLAQYALWDLGADVDRELAVAAALASPSAEVLFKRFIGADPERRSLEAQAYYRVETHHGIGIVDREPGRFEPTFDLAGLGVELADVVDCLEYKTTTISVGGSLPRIWFPGGDPRVIDGDARRVRGCVSLHARFRSSDPRRSLSRTLMVILGEAADQSAAERLAAASDRTSGAHHAALAVTSGGVFGVIAARSVVQGRPLEETPASIERFRSPLASVITRDHP